MFNTTGKRLYARSVGLESEQPSEVARDMLIES